MKSRLIILLFSVILLCTFMVSCNTAQDDPPDSPPIQPVIIPPQDVRIVSVNVGYTIDNMNRRGELMVPLLLSYVPDSIGTQECGGYTAWTEFFEEGLVGYERVGRVSNGAIETSEHYSGNYIYYNAEKYDCVDWYTFWVTDNPSQISSYRNSMYRTCTWIVLQDKVTGFRFVHINTHLAFENDEINEFQVTLVREVALRFEKLGLPVFITGDFNSSEGSTSYNVMTSPAAISDSKYLAEKSMSSGTFRGWNDRDLSGGSPIDFCFVTGERMTVHEYAVIDTFIDGVGLTDHQGIFVHATIHEQADSRVTPYPISTDGIIVTETSCRNYVYEFSFTQAWDIELIHKYSVELYDSVGNKVAERTILSRHLDIDFEDYHNCTFTSLEPGEKYTVKLYAVALDGTYSEPLTFDFTTEKID